MLEIVVYVYTYTHRHVCVSIHVRSHTQTHTQTHTHTHTHTLSHTHSLSHTHHGGHSLAVVVFAHVESLDGLGVVVADNRSLENHLNHTRAVSSHLTYSCITRSRQPVS